MPAPADSPQYSPKRDTKQQFWNSKGFQEDVFKEYADNGKLNQNNDERDEDKDYLESVDSDEIREIQRQYEDDKRGMRLQTDSKN